MSIDRKSGQVTISCDGKGCLCNHADTTGSADFRDTWRAAREEGWVNASSFEKQIQTWRHYCPRCAKQMGID